MTRGDRFDPADAAAALPDDALKTLLIGDPERGWHAFVDQHSPTLVALIERAGVADRDAVGDVYVRVCERLAEDRCRRLRRFDPGRGPLVAWLTVVVRRVVVDWVRERAGRRRLFGSVRELDALTRRVFELYYWEQARVSEIVVRLRSEMPDEAVDSGRVLDALSRVDRALSDRQRRELVSQLARARMPSALDAADADEPVAAGADPESEAAVRELDERFAAALAQLPAEDAAILRLTYVQGWSLAVVRRALHLDELAGDRIERILAELRERLARVGIGAREAGTAGLRFLEEGETR
jgi:RNA polymerase sigma factor (sigma-70 family)